jgi:aspartate ammonia-lyase
MVMQTAMKVMANDYAITLAASRGELELNAFLPLIADALLESLSLLERAVALFRVKCVALLAPDRARCALLLDGSLAFATAYLPRLGYDRVGRIITANGGDPVKIKEALEREAD